MERFTCYKKITVNDQIELDPLSVVFNRSLLSSSPIVYKVSVEEAYRPDLIASKFYGDQSYWWAVMVFNDIIDPFENLVEGVILYLPVIDDIIKLVANYKLVNGLK